MSESHPINQTPISNVGPDVVSFIQAALRPISTLVLSNYERQLQFFYDVTRIDPYLIDPPGTTGFVFVASPGSPDFASLGLPVYDGLGFYNFRYEIDNNWSTFQTFAPGSQFFFQPGVSGFEVQSFYTNGRMFALPDGFLFDVSFGSIGTFSGVLNQTITDTPEPGSLALLCIGTVCFFCLRAKVRSNAV
ncbi:MAG: PEP-CTERM sorting domain-containing protein [Planctomycetaceae bacterium]|nr:PEP-CTERM sorting domain-containing protein [Planctomycetaceae bacterium]